jgi:hypothetical protein
MWFTHNRRPDTSAAMANVPSEADRLYEAGRKKILHTCLLWGGQLVAILVLAGLQWAGTVRLEEYFWADQDKVDLQKLWLVLAVFALFQFFVVALGVLQGWGAMRRAKQLRQQSAPGRSNGVSGEAR